MHMNRQQTQEIFAVAPSLLSIMKGEIQKLTGQKSEPFLPIVFGFECGVGWFDLLKETFQKLEAYVQENKITGCYVAQVKEKFGGLRIYLSISNPEINNILDDATQKSYTICEICGKSGKLQNQVGWSKTLCVSCNRRPTSLGAEPIPRKPKGA